MISLKEVKKSYFLGANGEQEVKILHGVNLEVKKGEFAALMGPSGSGKSTLMNIVGCLDTLTEGKYSLNGIDVSKMSNDELAEVRNQEVGFVFQSFNLLNNQSALKNVSLPSFYAGREDVKKAKLMLERVGLGDRINHKPNEMSGGQRQRVAIARALMNDPELILADEPTGNLDSKSAKEVMSLLCELYKKEKKTIVLVTHDKPTAEYAKRKIYLKDGLIVDKLY